jgi:hypothetical protein
MLVSDTIKMGDNDEKRNKQRNVAMKKLNALQSSEVNGSHLNNIKSMTFDGEGLIGDNLMNSEGVLERVIILFDDEE